MSALRFRTAPFLATCFALAVAALAPAILHSQATLTADLSAYSGMVWRGVTTTNRPVLDPSLELVLPNRFAELTLGAWSNAEPAHYRPATMLDSYGGAPGPLFSMHELCLSAARPLAGATVSLGASSYLYPQTDGLASQYNTVELHGSVALAGGIAPTVSVHYDVGRVGGGYVELSGSRDLRSVGRVMSVEASAGWSVGQGAGNDPEAIAYFARDGFTHAEASVATELQLGSLTLSPSLHVAYASDPWTRSVAPDQERRIKGWVGTSLSWSRSIGGSRAAAGAARNANDRSEPAKGTATSNGKTPR